jgi:hypothetical protein
VFISIKTGKISSAILLRKLSNYSRKNSNSPGSGKEEKDVDRQEG